MVFGKRFPSVKCSLHTAKADVLRPVVVFVSAVLFKLWSNAAQFGIEHGDIYNLPDEFARTMLRFQTTLCSPSRDSLVPLPAIKLVTDYFHQAADSEQGLSGAYGCWVPTCILLFQCFASQTCNAQVDALSCWL